MNGAERYGDAWVCTDCYFAHHGMDELEPADCTPLGLLDGFEIADNTCSNHYYQQGDVDTDVVPCDQCYQLGDENGNQEFSWSQCEGCGSHLGGSRHRLALWLPAPSRR